MRGSSIFCVDDHYELHLLQYGVCGGGTRCHELSGRCGSAATVPCRRRLFDARRASILARPATACRGGSRAGGGLPRRCRLLLFEHGCGVVPRCCVPALSGGHGLEELRRRRPFTRRSLLSAWPATTNSTTKQRRHGKKGWRPRLTLPFPFIGELFLSICFASPFLLFRMDLLHRLSKSAFHGSRRARSGFFPDLLQDWLQEI